MISMELAPKCSICSFQLVRTSEIQFALFEGVEVGEGVVDQFHCKTHFRLVKLLVALELRANTQRI